MELVKYEAARKALAEAKSVDEVKQIKDKAEAIRHYGRQANDIELTNWAAEIKIRAERRLGEMLKAQEMNKGGTAEKEAYRSQGETSRTPTLSEMGITKSMSSRAQKIAAVSEEEFEAVIEEHKEKSKELTSATMQKLVKGKTREEKIQKISEANTDLILNKRYPVIYSDPPWQYEYSQALSRKIENQYPTMTLDDICALPLNEISNDDCILFMWATAPKLEESFRVINEWGFQYRSCAVWDKQKMGMGYYFRIQHELLLIAIKGDIPTPLPENRPRSVFSFPRAAHSEKPGQVAQLIEQMYPELNKLEMFSRSPRPGWDAWGNQSET